jgi:hypothetical protein
MNVKPLLDVQIHKYEDSKSVLISNDGIGVAVITSISFSRGSEHRDELKDLIGLPDQVYDHFYAFRNRKCYIKPNASLNLAELTRVSLEKREFSPEQVEHYLESWNKQINGITIKIAYADMLGNQQESYEITL